MVYARSGEGNDDDDLEEEKKIEMLIPKFDKWDDSIDSDFSDEHDLMDLESDVTPGHRVQWHSMGMDQKVLQKVNKFANLETMSARRSSDFDLLMERKDYSQIREWWLNTLATIIDQKLEKWKLEWKIHPIFFRYFRINEI